MICGNCGHDHTKRKCGCIPDVFWQQADVREAVARSDVTRIVRLLRARTDLTQEAIANMTGLSQGMVSQVESGKRSLRNQTKKSRALEGLGVPQIRPCASEGQLPPQEKRRTVENPPSSLEAETNGLRSLSAVMTHGSELEVVQAFRCADRQMGGGRLYRMVMEFLTTRIGPRLVSETSTPATFTAAAGLTEMAGWMAHDAGHDQAAARHFQNAIRFAQAAEVTDSLAAQIWASRSHLALHLGRPRQAVEFAEQGYQLLNGGEDAALQGRLLAMLARGYALLGETTLCLQALIQAERILSHPHRRWGSEWTSPFDEGSLASEAARCLVDLKDFTAASDHARHALVLRSAERIRARALASLVLARAAVGQRDLEQACALVSQVGTATETLGSVVVADQFRDAVDALAAFHDTEAVSKALPQLQSASDRRGGMRRVLHPGSGEQAR